MPTILDNFVLIFGEQGAKQLQKTIDNIGKAVVESTKKAISAYNKLEQARKNSNANLIKGNKERSKYAKERMQAEEALLPLGEKLEKSRKKIAKLEKEVSESSKKTVNYQKKSAQLAKEKANYEKLSNKYRKEMAKYGKTVDSMTEQEKINLELKKSPRYKEYKKTQSLEAYDKQLEYWRNFYAKKAINQKKGHERSRRMAIQAQGKADKEADRERKKAEKAERDKIKQQEREARELAKAQANATAMSKKAIAKTAILLYATYKLVSKAYNFATRTVQKRISTALSYLSTGYSGREAQGFDVALRGYGGAKGEGIELLSRLNAQLGAMRFGDTSLQQVAGMFGVGGISAYTTPKELLRAIWERSKGMDKASQEAMFSAFGLPSSVKGMMRKGNISELDFETAASEFQKTDSDAIKSIESLEEQIARNVEEIASAVVPLAEGVAKVIEFYTNDVWGGVKALGKLSFGNDSKGIVGLYNEYRKQKKLSSTLDESERNIREYRIMMEAIDRAKTEGFTLPSFTGGSQVNNNTTYNNIFYGSSKKLEGNSIYVNFN